jgi:outer membrane protein, multidrug efflux system
MKYKHLIPLAASLLSGCVYQPVTAPTRDMPSTFSHSQPPIAESLKPRLQQKWWQDFNDPNLNQWITTGLAANQNLTATLARLQQSQANLRQANSQKWPELNATGKRQRSWVDDGSDRELGDQWTAGLSANYEIDFWGRVDALSKQAQFELQAESAAVQVQANTVAANVAQYWFGWVAATQKASLLDSQQERVSKALTAIEGRFRRGRVSITDVWRQRQLLETLEGQKINAEADIALNRNQLALWVGQTPYDLDYPDSALLPALPVQPETGIPATQIQARPDVQQAWADVEAANAAVAAAISDRFPRISLSADYTGAAERSSDLIDSWVSNLAANLVLPIIDGGNRRAQVDRRKAQLDEQLANYQQTLLQAIKEVEDALIEEKQQAAFLTNLRERVELSQKTVTMQGKRYLNGVTDFLDLLSAQQNSLELEQQKLDAQRRLLEIRIRLYRSLSHGGYILEGQAPEKINSAT